MLWQGGEGSQGAPAVQGMFQSGVLIIDGLLGAV